jgi:hypothetical protein
VQVRSKPGKPLVVNFPSPVELERFLAAVGTSEPAHAGLMLCGILEAACDGLREEDVNRVLAAVTSIGAKDEIEGMLATQMVATHVAVIGTLRRQKESETLLERDRYGSLARTSLPRAQLSAVAIAFRSCPTETIGLERNSGSRHSEINLAINAPQFCTSFVQLFYARQRCRIV